MGSQGTRFDKRLLKAAFAEKGLTLADCADHMGIDTSTLSKKMNGKSEWTLSNIHAVAKLIGEERALSIFFGSQVS